MKARLSAVVSLTALAVGGTAHGAYLGLSVEPYFQVPWFQLGYVGLSTYRVYALFDAPDEGVVAVFGAPDNPMWVNSTDGWFFNSMVVNSLTAPMDLTPAIWTNQWDTYVTIGVNDAAGDATMLSPGFAAEVGDDLGIADGLGRLLADAGGLSQ